MLIAQCSRMKNEIQPFGDDADTFSHEIPVRKFPKPNPNPITPPANLAIWVLGYSGATPGHVAKLQGYIWATFHPAI